VTTTDMFVVSSYRHDGSTTIVEVYGDVDIYTAPEVRSALRAALTAELSHLVVDLSGVGFLDSTGLAAVFSAWRAASRSRIALSVVVESDDVRRPFEVSGMTELLPIVASRDRALAAAA
jgi:anti-sigma B factor antagonist